MANWKGLLAVVLNAYDLTSFVTVSTKEVCFKTEILHIFFKKWVIHMSKYFQSENQEFLIWGSRRPAVEKQKVAQFLPALLLTKQALKHNHHWEQYKKAKNEVNAIIKAAKTKYLSDGIKNSSGNKL